MAERKGTGGQVRREQMGGGPFYNDEALKFRPGETYTINKRN